MQWSPYYGLFHNLTQKHLKVAIPRNLELNLDNLLNDKDKYIDQLRLAYSDLKWDMIFIGEQNSGMYFHQDVAPLGSWQLLLTGEKTFVFAPPDHNDLPSRCSVLNAKEGDLVFYPAGYFHQTWHPSSPITVAISSSVIAEDPPYENFLKYLLERKKLEIFSGTNSAEL